MKIFNIITGFIKRYKHAFLPVIYFIFYMICFSYLERTVTTDFHIIHMKIDNYIPFCEFFVIPYYLWFLYIAATVVLFIFLDKKDFYMLCITLGVGMTLFLLISYLFPNGHNLRPETMPRNNIFTNLIASLYQMDTPTNIVPSIHCYNSLAAHMAIANSNQLKDKKLLRYTSLILCVSIILSTVFIKQHSMFDVLTAAALAFGMYLAVYGIVYEKVIEPN